MATLQQIYDFETALESAFRERLFDEAGLYARVARSKGVVPLESLAFIVTSGGATGDHHHLADDGLEIADRYAGEIEIALSTPREDGTDTDPSQSLHTALRTALRAWMVRGWLSVNSVLTLHEIERPPVPGATELKFSSDTHDITTLNYAFLFSIRAAAWEADV